MKLFRVYVDGALFYHPHLSKLAITQAQVQEDAENIDCLTLSAPFNHSYLGSIKPIAYHVDETVVTITGSGTVILSNDYMPVVPIVKTTAETALAWTVGGDTFRKSVSAGTWEFPELELLHGYSTVSVMGDGITTIIYREGRL